MNLMDGQSPPRPHARILLVDDEIKLLQSLAEGLRFEDWEVVTAANGVEALRLAEGREFDLMVLDWMLPDLDGMEVLRHARARAPRLPILMITARCGHADQVLAAQSGVTDYLAKPFAFDELVTRCRALIESVVRA